MRTELDNAALLPLRSLLVDRRSQYEGTTCCPESLNVCDADLARTLDIANNRPTPIVPGRHLIALGHRPDVWFGEILKTRFEAQLVGQEKILKKGVDREHRITTRRQPEGDGKPSDRIDNSLLSRVRSWV